MLAHQIPIILEPAFTPARLFESLRGAWIEPDSITLFTTATGTAQTAENGTVGLALDNSLGLNPATNHGNFYGVTASRIYTPDSVTSRVTVTLTVAVQVVFTTLTPAAQAALVSKRATTTLGWSLFVNAAGTLGFVCTLSGVNTTHTSSVSIATAGVTANTKTWIRVTRVSATGNVTFEYSLDGQSWTQIGTVRPGAAVDIDYDASPVEVGYRTFSALAFSGAIYRATVAGPSGVVVDFSPTLYAGGSTFVSTTGETWTIEGVSNITKDGNHAIQATATARPILKQSAGKWHLFFEADDLLTVNFASSLGSDCTVAYGRLGLDPVILTGQTVGTTYTVSEAATGTNLTGLVILNGPITPAQTDRLAAYIRARS